MLWYHCFTPQMFRYRIPSISWVIGVVIFNREKEVTQTDYQTSYMLFVISIISINLLWLLFGSS